MPSGGPFPIPTPRVDRSHAGGLGTVKTALTKAAGAYKAQADKKRAPHKLFWVGDMVYLSTKYLCLKMPYKKLHPEFIVPFPIVRVINPVTMELNLLHLLGRVHPVFHGSLLRPVEGSSLQPITRLLDPVIGDQYKIDKVLDSQLHRGR